jgi:predicted TIM-barrel fold metal-dependent hydrolase
MRKKAAAAKRPASNSPAVRVIDADSHFAEPPEVWSDYLDQRFRSAAPRRVTDNQGRLRRIVGGHMMPHIPRKPGPGWEAVKGASDPRARIKDMNRAGIDIMVNYPTQGLYFFGIPNVPAQVALCQAYNSWAADFCAHDRGRFVAPAIVPQIDVDATLAEAKRALDKLGLRGIFMRPNQIGGRNLDNPIYDPLWSLLEEYNAPLVLHEGTTQDVPQVGTAQYENYLFRHMVSHPFEQMMGLMSLIMSGVLERHPKLRVAVVECGVGWAPYWIDRMDDHQHHWGFCSVPLKKKPSQYFRRQVFVAAEGDERLLPFTVNAIGDDNICFSTDYPHPDHPFDGVVAGLKNMAGLSEASKKKILGANAARLFGI